MTRRSLRRTLFSAGVVLALAAVAPTAAWSPSDEERVLTLLERSGLAARIRETPSLAATQVLSALGGNTGTPTLDFTRLFVQPLAPEAILQSVTDALLTELDAETFDALVTGYRWGPGSDVAEAIARTDSPDGRAQLAGYARRIRSDPPSLQRRELVRQIDEATGLSETRTAIVVAMTVSVTRALDRTLGIERSGVQADPAWMIAAVRARLEAPTREQARAYLLFVTRTLAPASLSEFLELLRTDAARRYARTANAAYERGVGAGLETFDEHFTAWLAQQEMPALREAAREQGRSFGGGLPGDHCLREAFRRDRHCRDVACEAVNIDFLDACLAASLRTPELCAAASCTQQGRGDRFCRRLMTSVEARCSGGSSDAS